MGGIHGGNLYDVDNDKVIQDKRKRREEAYDLLFSSARPIIFAYAPLLAFCLLKKIKY